MTSETPDEGGWDRRSAEEERKHRLLKGIALALGAVAVLLVTFAGLLFWKSPSTAAEQAPVKAAERSAPAANAPAGVTGAMVVPTTVPPPAAAPAESAKVSARSQPAPVVKPLPSPTAPIRPELPKETVPAPTTLAARLPQPGDFVVQMGVFTSAANAEKLRAKLAASGIPAQIEARVHVVTRNRAEALRMRDKLQQLGFGTGLVVAVKK